MKRELLLGAGANHSKQMFFPPHDQWENLTTLDWNPDVKPDVLWNLENLPLPFEDSSFDEIHCYEVLEHLGTQGDFKFFFAQFEDIWRVLKPQGLFIASVPRWDSEWAWGDPSHKRVITPGTLSFLSQAEYRKQCGVTQMTDFRYCYKADFEVANCQQSGESMAFVLRAKK